jgi:hypothetical protein
MAWDSSRPVPWRRMVNEWLIYVVVMFIVILIAFRDQSVIGLAAGLLVSGPLYLAFGYVLAKFGYRRKSIRELRSQGGARPAGGAGDDSAPPPRSKPAPTSRTGGASGRPGGKRKRR